MSPALLVLWSGLAAAGVAVIVLGVVLRRRGPANAQSRANGIVLAGIALVVAGSAGLRSELSR